MKPLLIIGICCCLGIFALAQNAGIKAGAENIPNYISLLKGKRVGIFSNHTSLVGNTHLVDTLLRLGVRITVIFGPEHGFRGTADAGEKVSNYIDQQTGIPVVSLYGAKRRPDAADVKEIDLLLFDIQDVGVRFYTYISSLEEFMEFSLESGIPLLILDRPNPNGFYVDGPVLDKKYRSFIGRQAVPTVYGMTIGEYALMMAGEGWLNEKANEKYAACKANPNSPEGSFCLKVIPCSGYDHKSLYLLNVKPSPNLPDMQSIYLYPSTCLFEGTALSEGRGTSRPFQVFGHPSLPRNLFAFTPQPNAGAKSSKHYGKTCYGWDLGGTVDDVRKKVAGRIQLKWIMEAYALFPQKDSFFLLPRSGKMEESFFNKLAGNDTLWKQLKQQTSESAIRATWEPALTQFKATRKKYLLYEDF